MHGIILKTVEAYLSARHGAAAWAAVAQAADLPDAIDTMRRHPPEVAERVLSAAAAKTGRPLDDLLEDMGTWLCTAPETEAIRRLLRFGGPSYPDMLYALDDMGERARLAVSDLDLPDLSLTEQGEGRFRIASTWPIAGAGACIVGILRALADDYGTLAVVAHEGRRAAAGFCMEMISVQVHDEVFADGPYPVVD